MPTTILSKSMLLRECWSIALIWLSIACCTTQLNAQELELADLIEKCERSVIRVDLEGGHGSGFVVDSEGTFVTNYHVLAGAAKANAIFNDGRTVPIVGTYIMDPKRDLVIAKMDASGLPPITLATQMPRKGESVMALGCPQGFNFSVTNGIVSGVRSSQEIDDGHGEYAGQWLQFDAPISPGNSGGPLVDRQGRVVAMNTFMIAQKAQNLNFGISCLDIVEALQKAKQSKLIPLAMGAAKIAPPAESRSEEMPPIPKKALQEYLARTTTDLETLNQGLRDEIKRLSQEMEGYKNAIIDARIDGEYSAIIFQNNSTGAQAQGVAFRSDAIRNRYIKMREQRAKELRQLQSAYRQKSEAGLAQLTLEFAKKFGVPLDTRASETVGFVKEARIADVVSEHLMVVIYEGQPYLMATKSTTGVFPNTMLAPTAAFVAGNKVFHFEGQSLNLTLLAQVDVAEILAAAGTETLQESLPDAASTAGLSGDSRAAEMSDSTAPQSGGLFSISLPENGRRTWRSKDGKFSVTAELVAVDKKTGKVKLKRIDGSTITVAISQLSDADQKLLNSK